MEAMEYDYETQQWVDGAEADAAKAKRLADDAQLIKEQPDRAREVGGFPLDYTLRKD